MEPLVEIKNLNLIYDRGTPRETHALRDIQLSIYPQEYVIFFGPSGCGKSTLLYCISGLLTPTDGQIMVNGKDITKFSSRVMADYHRKTIGIVFQAYNLIPTLSILDNVALPQTWRGAPRPEREAASRAMLAKFELGHVAKRLPQELSGGQQQRVAIARALMNDPPLVFGDEPVGNLDSKAARGVLDVFSQLNARERKAVVLVTHDPSLFSYADRVIFMRDGRIIKEERNPKKVSSVGRGAPEEPAQKIRNVRELADAVSDAFLFVSEAHLKDKMNELVTASLSGGMSLDDLMCAAERPFRDGGLAFTEKRASDLVGQLEQILFENELLKGKTDEELRRQPLVKEIGSLRKYVLSDYGMPLSFLQIRRLEEAIGGFVRGVIDEDAFAKLMTLPEISGGVGLSAAVGFDFLFKLKMVTKLR